EQDIAPADPADRADVDRMLVAHGQRPSAPLELLKLEERRVNAEFAPRLEQARLRVAAAEAEVSATPPALLEKLTEARVGVSVAEAAMSEAAAALSHFQSRFEKIGDALAVVLGIALVVGILFLVLVIAVEPKQD